MDSIRNEDGTINIGEVTEMMKKLSALLTIDGLRARSLEHLALAQSLGVVAATMDIGGDAITDLAKMMQPASERIQQEMQAKNPKLAGLNSIKAEDLFGDDGYIKEDGIMEVVAKTFGPDIEDVLPDGVKLSE